MTIDNLPDAVLAELQELSKVIGIEPLEPRLPADFTEEQIAEYYGIHPITVSRHMKKDKRYKKIRVFDGDDGEIKIVWRRQSH
jgi:hypothetical protein